MFLTWLANGFFFFVNKVLPLLRCSLDVGFPEGVLGLIFTGYVLLASQGPYPIIAYSVASYRPHLSHFWANT